MSELAVDVEGAKAANEERARQAATFGLDPSTSWTEIRDHVRKMAKTSDPRILTPNPEDWEDAIIKRFGNVFK